jgi:4-hydroxythreonine-4-phosphate dehydrogenase
VLGLNPHAGDNGVIGKEEEDVIKPTIKSVNRDRTVFFRRWVLDGQCGIASYRSG